jgi:hypothetical protein
MINSSHPEMSSERFLRHNAGRGFCKSCLAIHAGLTLQQAGDAFVALGEQSEFTVDSARCLSCSRTSTLIRAMAS